MMLKGSLPFQYLKDSSPSDVYCSAMSMQGAFYSVCIVSAEALSRSSYPGEVNFYCVELSFNFSYCRNDSLQVGRSLVHPAAL